MTERERQKSAFLEKAGWQDARITPLTADASTRKYARLEKPGQVALLMDAPPAAESAACPPEADEQARQRLGYNAMARLAGPRLEAFTGLAGWLRAAGVHAPLVYADDPADGFAVIEDFGDTLLAQAVQPPGSEASLYRKAMEVLRRVRQVPATPGLVGAWPLQTYDRLVLQTEANLLVEWYGPHADIVLTDEARQDWNDAWQQVLAGLSAPSVLALRDYHAENIIMMPGGELAVIDFQDALIGQAAYDVVSLLEDARRDVDLGLADELYTEDRDHAADPAAYAADFAILAAQRNAKILGIFARLIHRDGKEKYRWLIPRVQDHFARDLKRPGVEPVAAWAERYVPNLLEGSGQ